MCLLVLKNSRTLDKKRKIFFISSLTHIWSCFGKAYALGRLLIIVFVLGYKHFTISPQALLGITSKMCKLLLMTSKINEVLCAALGI